MTLVPTRPATGRIPFVDELARHGSAPAVVTGDRTVSYGDLDRLVDDTAARLGPDRRLVLVEAANDLDSLVAYLGALRGGHVVLLSGRRHGQRLVSVHDPDVVIGGPVDHWVERREGSDHDLHPDLAVLLSTSGSTGSPKLVRLSHRNVSSNASAIADYLRLTPSDRSISSLPMQYCYGLSVLHSHLAAGASIVLTGASVVDPCFWDAVERHGVTNFAGVPHTFELLERTSFTDRSPASIRFVTQAGGRMDPATIRRWAGAASTGGWELFVMYGQTEATARMAYLPPELTASRAEAVGVPVPGGAFRIEPFEGARPGEGEVVYTGPNVMMGYAESPADLCRPAELAELATGDVGRLAADGLLEIVGRRRDIIKPFGLRIDLGEVDRILAEHGLDARCAGDDRGVAVAVLSAPQEHWLADVGRLVQRHTGLPTSAVGVASLDELPRLETGKLDRQGLLDSVRSSVAAKAPAVPAEGSVAALLATALGVPEVAPQDSFVSLGGDSLSYVEVSVALEERIGRLPEGWHLLPVSALEDAATGGRRRVAHVETNVLLRAVAICLIVANHAQVVDLAGGAHVLFVAAGYNFARFQLSSGTWWRSILRLALPAVVWIGGAAALTDDFDLAHAALLHGWVGGPGRWVYWFVEVLVQLLVVVAVLLSIPLVRRFERRHSFAFPALLLGGALLVRFDVVVTGDHFFPMFRPHEIAWMFFLGWAASQAAHRWQRLVVTGVALLAVPGCFGDPHREAVLVGGLVLLLWLPSIPVPRPAHRLVGVVAAASLYTYLTHVQLLPLVSGTTRVGGVVVSVVAGVAVWMLVDPLVRRVGVQTPWPWRPSPDRKRAAPSRVSPDRTGTSPSFVSLASASSNGSPHCS
jgi:acyl-CoA synthetase (AMP-forming)/AMP-acid ligase II